MKNSTRILRKKFFLNENCGAFCCSFGECWWCFVFLKELRSLEWFAFNKKSCIAQKKSHQKYRVKKSYRKLRKTQKCIFGFLQFSMKKMKKENGKNRKKIAKNWKIPDNHKNQTKKSNEKKSHPTKRSHHLSGSNRFLYVFNQSIVSCWAS